MMPLKSHCVVMQGRVVPGAKPVCVSQKESHLALKYPPKADKFSFYYYWFDETSFLTFGNTISWWGL